MSPKSIQEKVWHFHFKWTAVFEQRNPQINPENPLSRSINLTHVYALRDSKIWAGLKGPRLGTVKSKSNPYSMAFNTSYFFSWKLRPPGCTSQQTVMELLYTIWDTNSLWKGIPLILLGLIEKWQNYNAYSLFCLWPKSKKRTFWVNPIIFREITLIEGFPISSNTCS